MLNKSICGIYTIQNLITGKYYVGESIRVYERWRDHLRDLRTNTHDNKHLQASYNKYGKENFSFTLIEECIPEIRFSREKYWIKEYNSFYHGYNMTEGGEDPKYYKDDNGEIKEWRHKNAVLSEREVLDIIERLKLGESICQIGKDYSVKYTAINDIRTHKTWRYLTEGIIFPKYNNKKAIDMYNRDGTLIGTFDSASDIEKEYHINKKHICKVCKGKKKTAGGYVFKYHGEQFAIPVRKYTNETPVDQYDMEWNYIRSFKSQKDAEREVGVKINRCVLGKSKSAGGYRWLKSGETIPNDIKQQQIKQYAEKLSEEKILQIVDLLMKGECYSVISEITNVSSSVIGAIKRHEIWKKCTEGLIFPKSNSRKIAAEKTKKPIDMYDVFGNYIESFSGVIDADKKLGIKYYVISSICCGKQKQTHGYVFRFKGDQFDKYAIPDRIKQQYKPLLN